LLLGAKFQGTRKPGANGPGNERARERKGPAAKVPGSELVRVLLADSLHSANWLQREKAVNRKYDINPELFFQLHEGDRRGHNQKMFKKI